MDKRIQRLNFYTNNRDGSVNTTGYIYIGNTINECLENMLFDIKKSDFYYIKRSNHENGHTCIEYLYDDTDPLFDIHYKNSCMGAENVKKHPEYNTVYYVNKTTLNRDVILQWLFDRSNCKEFTVTAAEYIIVAGSDSGITKYKIKCINNKYSLDNKIALLCYDACHIY